MNQRSKRSSKRKQDVNVESTVTPLKTTGDVKSSGLAKASPFFKPLEEAIKPKTKEEEKKIIAEAAAAAITIFKTTDKK